MQEILPINPASKRHCLLLLGAIGALSWASSAFADNDAAVGSGPSAGTQAQSPYNSAGNQPAASPDEANSFGLLEGVWPKEHMLGDIGGLRSFLVKYGINLNLQETSEILGNSSGGIKRGAYYDGLTTLGLTLDTDKAFGWQGGSFNASALQIHGDSLSAHNLEVLQTISGVEADHATRLWELWYEQSLWDKRLSVRLGEQSLDQEFLVSTYAQTFINGTFGWPALPSLDLPSGGSNYPLASPGVRIRMQPDDRWALLAGMFNDNTSGIAPGSLADPQKINAHGTNFRLSDAPFFIAELQYATPHADDAPAASTYRVGFWLDEGRFASQERDRQGLSLANPQSNGEPQLYRGDYSFYTVIDQALWQENLKGGKSLSAFVSAMGAPDTRNLINYSIDGGFTLKAPFKGRDDDVAGISVGYAHIAPGAQALDRATRYYANNNYPLRSGETILEATYQYQIVKWWQVQPDVQYALHPGGNLLNPDDANGVRRLGNETIIGVRTNITF